MTDTLKYVVAGVAGLVSGLLIAVGSREPVCRRYFERIGRTRYAAIYELISIAEDDHDARASSIMRLLDLPVEVLGAYSDSDFEDEVMDAAEEDELTPTEVYLVFTRHSLATSDLLAQQATSPRKG